MPNVSATPRQMGNGDVITQFFDSIGTSADTYTYPKTQEKLVIRNMGPASLSVTVAGVTQVIPKHDKWEKVVDFTSFSINAVTGVSAFDAWADEKGSTFDTPEGQYFQNNGGGSGGSGTLVYSNLTALQNALPNGSTSPVWVTADNSWYYWSGTLDTTPPTVSISPVPGTYAVTQSVTLTANETSTIYYTIDGSTPTESSSVYSSAISVATTKTVKYFAKDTSGNGSTVQTATYTIDAGAPDTTAPTVSISPAAGTYSSTQSVTLTGSDNSGGAVMIYYTTDGSTPTQSSSVYSSAISVPATATIKYFGKDPTGNVSTVQSATYTISSVTSVVSDNFNRADSTSAVGVSTTGQTWTALVGTWGITGNQLYQPVHTSESILAIDSGVADCTVQATFTVNNAFNRLAFRIVDGSNLLMVQAATAGKYSLFKRVSNTWSQIGASSTVNAVNNDVVKVVLSGSNVTVYVNGAVAIATQTVAEYQTATKHGFSLGSGNNTTARFDDFTVTVP